MKHLLLPIVFLFYACERENERQTGFEFKRPKVVEARPYKLNPDTLAPPVTVRATPPSKRILGKPEIARLASNVFPSRVTAIVPASVPQVIIPRGDKYELPRVVAAIDSPYTARPAEVIPAEGPHFAEDSKGIFSSIKARDGLHSDEISSLLQDKDGNIWIGEWWGGGISKYDGRYLWNYTIKQGLSSDVLNCIFADRQGNIWTGSYDNGVNKFDGKYFTHYAVEEGLPDKSINTIMQDKAGNIWIGTNKGLAKFDGRQFTHYTTSQGLPTNVIRSLLEDRKGQLWVGADGGLTRFDGQCFQNYTVGLNLHESTEISGLMEDKEGNIWFGTTVGLYQYTGVHIKKFTTEGGLSSNALTKIMQEKNGDIWIGTRGAGLNRYDGKSFIHYGPEQGLPNSRVTSLLQDKSGNIWLGTTGGVCKFEGKTFSHVTPIKEEEIEAMFPDSKGNVWMGSGTDSGLNKYDGENMMRYTDKNGLVNINYLFEDSKGGIWFATWNGVDRFDGKYLTHYSTANGLINDVVFTVMEDRHGNMWFATNKGLSKFDGAFFTNYSSAQGLNGDILFAIFEDHAGNIWIGTNDNGVCKFDGKTFTHFPKNNLSHPMVVGITEDRNNNIWICTGYGVNKYDGKQFTWFTTEQGLTNNIIKDVLEDKNGDIWIGTLNGLNRYNPALRSNDTFGSDVPSYFKNYTIADGFSGGGTYENSMFMDHRGIIWIGSNDRLTRYHPEGDLKDSIAPVLKLIDIQLFNEKVNWQDISAQKGKSVILHNGRELKAQFSGLSRWYNQPENLQLAYNNNYITFQFIGITTNRPKEVRYRYLLEGLDEGWTSTSQPVAVYNKLPHGRFNFRVRCVNSEGYWSNELNYSFVVFPPWWQTTFAYCTYVVAAIGLIWLFTWYRSRRLKAENILLEQKVTKRTNELQQSIEERYRLSEQIRSQQALLNERLRISRDLHDEIGSTLGSISIYSEVAKKRSEKNENPVTVLSKIGTASRELIEKMSDIVWSLNLNHENFEQMQHRMRAFATMMLSSRNIRYNLDVDDRAKRVQLTSAQAKNIFLIYKEALFNIVKYAECSSVQVNFSADNNQLLMTIRDNGKGFDPFSKETGRSADEHLGGNGIKNMYVRADEMKANLSIDSNTSEGSIINLTVPI